MRQRYGEREGRREERGGIFGPGRHAPVSWALSSLLPLLLFLLLWADSAAAQPYVRQVEAFAVTDADGTATTHPWLGGLNVPRPQFVDLDGDGDLDLLVQERSGALVYFENTGTASVPRFTWRTDAYAGLDVGEWARVADLDGDGDLDLLAEQPFGFVRLYRNDGGPAEARFTLAADTVYAVTPGAAGADRRTPLFADRQSMLAAADLDCDGGLDLLLPQQDGTLTYYRHEGLDAAGIPRWRFVTATFQDIRIVGAFGKQQPTAGTRHGAAAITFADVDGDDDLDLYWGDFFSPSLYVLENAGTCAAPVLQRTADVYPPADPLMTRGYNAPQFADLDGDGDLDLFVGVLGGAFAGGPYAADTFYFYENTGASGFTLRTRQFISSLDVGQQSRPAFADLDRDGDLDLLVGNSIDPVTGLRADLVWYVNEGTPAAPAYRRRTEPPVDLDGLVTALGPTGNVFNLTPAVADLDGDGDADLLVGRFDGGVAFYRNDGTPAAPAFVLAEPTLVTLRDTPSGGSGSAPALADLDGDGDLDLVVGEMAGTLNGYRNTGTPAAPVFTPAPELFGVLDAGSRSAPALADLDGDGDLDLVVGSEQDGLAVYRNTGTPRQAAWERDAALDVRGLIPREAAPVFADVDGDGDADLLVGGRTGGLFFYRNDRLVTATVALSADPAGALRVAPPYPHPVRSRTTLQVSLAQKGRVHLAVYDVLGRRVAVLHDGVLPAGTHPLTLDASGWPPGVYAYLVSGAHGTRATGNLVVFGF